MPSVSYCSHVIFLVPWVFSCIFVMKIIEMRSPLLKTSNIYVSPCILNKEKELKNSEKWERNFPSHPQFTAVLGHQACPPSFFSLSLWCSDPMCQPSQFFVLPALAPSRITLIGLDPFGLVVCLGTSLGPQSSFWQFGDLVDTTG